MPFRNLFGDDIFISYARRDSSVYATGLRAELEKQGFSCFTDRLGTKADKNVPPSLLYKVRGCGMMVVVGTEWSGTRTAIEDEIREFKKTGRTIVPIDIDGKLGQAVWYPLIEGIAPEPENNTDALVNGNPSPSVVERIKEAFLYSRRNQRVRRATLVTAAVLLMLIGASLVAAYVANSQAAKASSELERARLARAEADEAAGEALTAKREAEQAKKDAVKALGEAEQAKKDAKAALDEAEMAKDEAAVQRRAAAAAAADAREKTRLAEAATRRAEDARREAAARAAANRASARLAQAARMNEGWGEMLQQGTLLSAESARRLRDLGLASADSTQSLREALTLLPRSREKLPHSSEVEAAFFTPDGKYLATFDDQNEFHVWNVATRREVGKGRLASTPMAVEFTPDGGLMFTVDDDGNMAAYGVPGAEEQARWSKSGIVVADLPAHKAAAFDLRPDGKYIAAAVKKDGPEEGDPPTRSVVVWNMSDGEVFTKLGYEGQLNGLALSPAGDLLAVCLEKGPTGDRASESKTEYVAQVWSVSSPSRLVASARWESGEEGKSIHEWETLQSPAFSPDGRLLAVSNGYSVVVLDVGERAEVRPGEAPREAAKLKQVAGIEGFPDGEDSEHITYIKFSPDGRSLGVVGDEFSVQTWEVSDALADGKARKLWQELRLDGPSVRRGAGLYVVAGGRGSGSRFVDLTTGREVSRVLHFGGMDGYVADPANGRLAVFDRDDVWLYDTGSAQEDARLVHRGEGHVAAFTPDRRYAALVEGESAYSFDIKWRNINVWEVTAGREVARLTDCVSPNNVTFSHDGSRLAATCADGVRVWSLAGRTEVWRVPDVPSVIVDEDDDESYNVQHLVFDPGGRHLVINALKGGKIVDVAARSEVAGMSWGRHTLVFGRGESGGAPPDGLTVDLNTRLTVAFSPGGKYLTMGGGTVVRLWGADGGPAATVTPDDKMTFHGFNFSPDEKYLGLLVGNIRDEKSYAAVWDIAQGREVVRAATVNVMGHIAFSPDGRYAVTHGASDSAQVLDLAAGRMVATLPHAGRVNEASFSTDSRLIATASDDLTARVWEVGKWCELTRVRHEERVRTASLTSNGSRLATVGDDLTARLWLVSDEEMMKRALDRLPCDPSSEEWARGSSGEVQGRRPCPVGPAVEQDECGVPLPAPRTAAVARSP